MDRSNGQDKTVKLMNIGPCAQDLLDLVDVNWRESAAGASEGRSRQRRHYPDFFDESTDETGEMPFVDDPALFSAEALGLFQGNGSFLTSIQVCSSFSCYFFCFFCLNLKFFLDLANFNSTGAFYYLVAHFPIHLCGYCCLANNSIQ